MHHDGVSNRSHTNLLHGLYALLSNVVRTIQPLLILWTTICTQNPTIVSWWQWFVSTIVTNRRKKSPLGCHPAPIKLLYVASMLHERLRTANLPHQSFLTTCHTSSSLLPVWHISGSLLQACYMNGSLMLAFCTNGPVLPPGYISRYS